MRALVGIGSGLVSKVKPHGVRRVRSKSKGMVKRSRIIVKEVMESILA